MIVGMFVFATKWDNYDFVAPPPSSRILLSTIRSITKGKDPWRMAVQIRTSEQLYVMIFKVKIRPASDVVSQLLAYFIAAGFLHFDSIF